MGINVTRTKEKKRHAGQSGYEKINYSMGLKGCNSPVLDVVAQRIIIPIGPNPRKRPRTGVIDSDPFLLDDIINEFKKGGKGTSKSKSNSLIPDLNTATAGSAAVIDTIEEGKESEENQSPTSVEGIRNEEQRGLRKEINDTIEIRQVLGINLRNKEELCQVRRKIVWD
ncbi:hypothetical protein L1987_03296 [Smallanthus sonchifolius]|uniref:Uncharacterized protein n=1 Tax=Smallanthus sonchifolius TaxID=185202 RepID=A0ACB9KAD9_9ASTR|nr:hypothetical protein L1987_03296 [Smallanthus sonchifolius]